MSEEKKSFKEFLKSTTEEDDFEYTWGDNLGEVRNVVFDNSPTTISGGNPYTDAYEKGRFKKPLIPKIKRRPPPKYYEPPDLKDVLITDVRGKKRPLNECLNIGGNYYHSSDKDVFKDELTGKLEHIQRGVDCVKSLCIVNSQFKIETCKISQSNLNRVIPIDSRKYKYRGNIISLDGICDWDFKEDLSTGCLIDVNQRDQIPINEVTHYAVFKNRYLGSNLDKKTELKMGISSPSYQISEGIKYSIGLEFECARGFIPEWKASMFNISSMRDGSLNGGNGGMEVVTGVLKGDTGFYHLQEICNELNNRTTVDKYCGSHLHIGGLRFTDQFLVNVYLLASILESDIMSVLPPSRRNNQYCRKLKKFSLQPAINSNSIQLQEDYLELFRWISYEKVNNPTFNYNKTKQHPMGPKCGYNHDTPRYCWLNLVPAMFCTRDREEWKTLEFRNFEGTTNFEKVKNWTLLCMAIVKFADKYPESINNSLTINDVLSKIYSRSGQYLIDYFNQRRKTFSSKSFSETEWYQLDKINDIKLRTIKELANFN